MARKTAAKKSVPSTKETNTTKETVKPTSKFSFFRNKLFIVVIVLVVLLAAYALKGLFIAALVNGKPIYRLDVISQLEQQSGGQVLEAMVNEAIIKNELKKQNITVSQEEINAEVKKISDLLTSQQQTLDEALKQRGMSRKDLEEQIVLNKGVEKLLGKDITVTDSEISAFIEQNKAFLPEASSEAELQAQAKEQLIQQKISEKYQTWVDNARKNANILYFVDYKLPQQ